MYLASPLMALIVELNDSRRDLKNTLRIFAKTVPVSRRMEYNSDLILPATLAASLKSSMAVML